MNIWKVDNNPLHYGGYFSIVLGCMPQYIIRISSDTARYVMNQYDSNTSDDYVIDYRSTYAYTTFKGVIPAFVRGFTFYKLKHNIGNAPLSAFLASSIMSFMLDQSETYTTMSTNIIISSLNASANNIQYLKFNSFLDTIYPGSSIIITIEFAEYFLRLAEVDSIINTAYDEYMENNRTTMDLTSIDSQNNSINDL